MEAKRSIIKSTGEVSHPEDKIKYIFLLLFLFIVAVGMEAVSYTHLRDTLQLLRTYKLAAHYFYDSERYKEATEMMSEGNRIAALRGDTAARLDLLRSVANIGEGNDDFEGLILSLIHIFSRSSLREELMLFR